jgi:hypothetical protein
VKIIKQNNANLKMLSFRSLRILFVFINLALLFHTLGSNTDAEVHEVSDEEKILSLYERIRDIEIDPLKAVRLDDFSFKKDIFEWRFESGYLWLTKPIPECPNAGGAYFIGQGQIVFDSPNQVEQEELKKYAGKEHLKESFEEAFIRFNDDTYQIFSTLIHAAELKEAEKAASKFQKRQNLLDELSFNLEFPIIEDYFSEIKRNQYLFIETKAEEIGWLAFFYNPMDEEEISFFIHRRLDKATGFSDLLTYSSICKFNKREDYEKDIDLDYENKDLIHVFHYDIDLSIKKNSLLMHAKVTLHFKSLEDNLSVVQFPLWAEYDPDRHDNLISIEKIEDKDGNKLSYLYKNFTVLAQLPKVLNENETAILSFYYEGDFIRHVSESTFTLLNDYHWFPKHGYMNRSTFDLTIKVPKPYIAASTGKTIKRWEEGKYNCMHAREERPIASFGVVFGKYVIAKDDEKRPVIYAYSFLRDRKQAESIMQESRTIIDNYEKYFEPFPYEEFDIVQMAHFYGFGQALPGLIQLTGETFLTASELEAMSHCKDIRNKSTFRSEFLAHEIGHEWWGGLVGWQNYHEQWLSEAFTEYFSGLYLEALKGTTDFEEKLKEWKNRAFSSKESGPIWLGVRLAKNKHRPYDFVHSLYDKGARVLHMLRMAFIHYFGNEEGNKLFFECMKSFCEKLKDSNATTRDFQNIIKETAKIDMDWFFDQWFRESGIPEVHFSYHVRKTEDGKYLLEGRLKQLDNEHFKILIVPIFIHFSGDKVHKVRKVMDKGEITFRIKAPMEPQLVSIDDHEDLLASFVYD